MLSLPEIAEKIHQKRRRGLLWFYLWERVSGVLSSLGIKLWLSIVYRESKSDPPPPAPKLQGWELIHFNETNIDRIMEMKGNLNSPEELRKRLTGGSGCLGLLENDKVVSVTWCVVGGGDHKRLPFRMTKSTAYLYGAFTDQDYRGRNLWPFLRYHMCQELANQGIGRLYSVCDFFNTPARRAKEKLSAQPYLVSLYISVFGRFERTFTLYRYGPMD